jgi:hypothetical protein
MRSWTNILFRIPAFRRRFVRREDFDAFGRAAKNRSIEHAKAIGELRKQICGFEIALASRDARPRASSRRSRR